MCIRDWYTTIPWTETPKPLYKAVMPPALAVLPMQSTKPVNSRSLFEPTSAAKRVRAKSSGYTINKEPAPAKPPDAMLTAKNDQNASFGEYDGNKFLIVSLNAKLKACVGK